MSHLKAAHQNQFTCHTYTMQDIQNLSVKFPHGRHRIPFYKKRQQVNINNIKNMFSPQETNLFCRRVVFLSKAQINSLPTEMANKGWKTFFDAMYLLIQRKNSPQAMMSPDEVAGKNVNIPEAITLLTSIIEKPADEIDSDLKPITLMLLAYFYNHGWGTDKNTEKAKSLYTEAMNLGIDEAKVELACIEAENYDEKLRLLTEAKNAGSIKALIELGKLYADNKFSQHNPKTAVLLLEQADKMLKTATHMNRGEAAFELAFYYINQEDPKANKKIISLLEHAASHFHPAASTILGVAHMRGELGLKKNKQKAEGILLKAHQDRFGEASRGLIKIYQEKNDYKNVIKYSLKAIRYGSDQLNDILAMIFRTNNDNTSEANEDERKRNFETLIAFNNKNGLKYFIDQSAVQQINPTTPEDIERANEALYNLLFSYITDPTHQKLLEEIDKARTPAHLRFIKNQAIPLFKEFNEAITYFESFFHLIPIKLSTKTDKILYLLKNSNNKYKYLLQTEHINKYLTVYASCTPLDILYLKVLLKNDNFYDLLLYVLPLHQLKDTQHIKPIYKKLVLLTLQLAVMPLEEFKKAFYKDADIRNHYTIFDRARDDIKPLMANYMMMHKDTRLLDNFILLSIDYKDLICKGGLNKIAKVSQSVDKDINGGRNDLLEIIELTGSRLETEEDKLQESISEYSIKDRKILAEALKTLNFNANNALSLLPPLQTQAQKVQIPQYARNIEKAINKLHAEIFADEIEAEKARKAAEAEQKALEAQKKREEIQRRVLQTTKKNAENACTTYREKINTTEMSDIRRENLSALLEKMLQMNQLIQETTEYTQAHNKYFQKLKKKFDEILGLPQTQIAEDYESIAGSAIAKVETYMSASINAKREIMEREARRQAEEAEKLKAIEAAQATRAANRADKQKEYQEAQEALKAQETFKSESSSDEETTTVGAIASFKGKDAKQILESQKDEFAGNAVSILNLIQESKSFTDITSKLSQGDNLHELKGKEMTLENREKLSCFAVKVNEQYRITFYWSTIESKAYKVWFGDYHIKQ